MKESSLLRGVEKLLRDRGIVFRKRHGSALGTAGDPDIFFVIEGLHAEVELKRPGEQPTPLQAARLKSWADAGAIVGCIHTLDEMREFLDLVYTYARCTQWRKSGPNTVQLGQSTSLDRDKNI